LASRDNQDALERLQQRASEVFLKQHEEKHEDEKDRVDAWRTAHKEQHLAEAQAISLALDGERHRLAAHREAIEKAQQVHEKLHEAHASAHEQRHEAEYKALVAATSAMDRRLDQMNEFREQLRDQAASFVRQENFDTFKDERRHALTALDASIDVRIDSLTKLIQTEREERRATEGVKRGMSATTAIIVTAISVVGVALGIIVVVVNLLTGSP
jgi:hypothetical protein